VKWDCELKVRGSWEHVQGTYGAAAGHGALTLLDGSWGGEHGGCEGDGRDEGGVHVDGFESECGGEESV
jgi:hypothetical protein